MREEITRNIERHLRKVDYIIRQKGREILKDTNMTIPQFNALQILINNEEMTIGELSQAMYLACSTITDLVYRMEKSKLVVRKRDKKDKRVVRIEVLPIGHEIVKDVLDNRVRFLEDVLESLDEETILSLDLGLSSLYKALNEE